MSTPGKYSTWHLKKPVIIAGFGALILFSVICIAFIVTWIYTISSGPVVLLTCGGAAEIPIFILLVLLILIPIIWWTVTFVDRWRKGVKPVNTSRYGLAIQILRWLFTLTGIVALVAILVWSSVWINLRITTTPNTSGSLILPGLIKPVSIKREPNGVIHIIAQNEHDMYFAQGVAQAQERLWQMEFQRRVGSGRLSEIVGSAGLQTDLLLRTIGVYKAAKESLKYYSKGYIAVMEAFLAGVNAYLDTNPPLPLEFKLLGIRPEKFKLEDVIVWAKMMSFSLSKNFFIEIQRYQMLQNGLSVQRVNELLPHFPEWGLTVLSQFAMGLNVSKNEEQKIIERLTNDAAAFIPQREANIQKSKLDDMLPMFLKHMPDGASNNWVIHGKKTATGAPLMSDDPHLSLTSPGIWMLMHLQSNETNTIGSCFVGVPGVVIGRNDYIAWAVTNVGADNQDLYALEETPDGKGYIRNGVFEPYKIREEVFKVKGEADHVVHVKESVYGPVINNVTDVKGVPLSLHWISLVENDTTFEAFWKISLSKNWSEFKECFRNYLAPSQNFVFADLKTGDIGYIAPGAFPKRKYGHSGRFPVPGDGNWDWQGFVPFEEYPQVFNPPENYIVTANNMIVPWAYNQTITLDWEQPFRSLRITELVEQSNNLTVQDMIDIQMDAKSPLFQKFSFVFSQIEGKLTGEYEEWRKRLTQWDGVESMESQEASVFEKWYEMMAELATNEAKVFTHNPTYLFKALSTNSDTACDLLNLSCMDFAAEALKNAIDKLYSQHGHIPNWGKLHIFSFDHQILGSTPLKCIASNYIGSPGGTYTVNVGPLNYEKQVSVHGASFRMIVDGSNPENSLFITAPGQNGNMLSKEYNAWLSLWRGNFQILNCVNEIDGKYLEMKMIDFETHLEQTLIPKNLRELA